MQEVTVQELKIVVAQSMGADPEELDPQEELYDQGMNSLQLVKVLTWLQEQGYDLSFADLAEDTRLVVWEELVRG